MIIKGGTEAMTRSHVTMISICKHSCVADATSNKNNFSTKDASMKRHVEDAHPARRKTRRKVGVTSRYVSLAREFAQMCPACLNKCERDGARRRYVRPETFARLLQNCTSTRLQVRAYV